VLSSCVLSIDLPSPRALRCRLVRDYLICHFVFRRVTCLQFSPLRFGSLCDPGRPTVFSAIPAPTLLALLDMGALGIAGGRFLCTALRVAPFFLRCSRVLTNDLAFLPNLLFSNTSVVVRAIFSQKIALPSVIIPGVTSKRVSSAPLRLPPFFLDKPLGGGKLPLAPSQRAPSGFS